MSVAPPPSPDRGYDDLAGAVQHEAARLVALLRARGWSLAVAESLTGGLLAASVVAVPGASAVFRGGVVAYATDVKHAVLGVDEALLKAHGAVHPDVAAQMADGVRRVLAGPDVAVEVGVATTGIAGPESPDGQPVGTVHIGVSTPAGTSVRTVALGGTRDEIRLKTVREALAATSESL